MADSSDLDYNPNGNGDIDFPRKKQSKRKGRNTGRGKNNTSKLTVYQCSLCLFQTGLRNTLKRHFAVCFLRPKSMRHQWSEVNRVTSGATFKCEFCFFSTTTSFLLVKHKKAHANRIRTGLVECSHCNLEFFTMSECKKHMTQVSIQPLPDIEKSHCLGEEESIEEDISVKAAASDKEEFVASQIVSNSATACTTTKQWYSCWCNIFHSVSRSIYLHHLKTIHNVNISSLEELNKNENYKTREGIMETERSISPMADCTFHTDAEDDLEMHRTEYRELEASTDSDVVLLYEIVPSHSLKRSESIESVTEQENGGQSIIEQLGKLQEQVKCIEVGANDDEKCLLQTENQPSFGSHVFEGNQMSNIQKNQELTQSQPNGFDKITPELDISEWLVALEDEIVNDNNIETFENETIRIEIVADEPDEIEVDSIQEDNIRKSALRIKCQNPGCNYYSRFDSQSLKKHAMLCSKETNILDDTFKCKLCEKVCPSKQSLVCHLTTTHFSAEKSKNSSEVTSNVPGKITYKCLMCGIVILCKSTLKNHAHIHAREENNCEFIVRFSEFKGDIKVNTIEIKSDSNFIPRKSSNVPVYKKTSEKHVGSPVLDYDPNLPIFSCLECNFKTNEENSLAKHKKLHWNSEKDAAYKSKQWFTCEICFYYCFDAVRLKQHREKHKKRSVFAAKKL